MANLGQALGQAVNEAEATDIARQTETAIKKMTAGLQPEDPQWDPKWTVHDDGSFNPNNLANLEDASAGAVEQGWVATTGPGTFYSPFSGELASFPGSAQYDMMAWWFAQKFQPGQTPHWSGFVFGAEWDQQGSDVSAHCGGTWGSRLQKVDIPLLQTLGDTDASNVPADVNHYDPAVIGKTTRECFLEGYGYRFLHPGPSAGTIVLDVAAGIGAGALAIFTGGVGLAGIAAAAGAALAAASKTIGDAKSSGITIPADVENAARLFAYLQIPPAPAPTVAGFGLGRLIPSGVSLTRIKPTLSVAGVENDISTPGLKPTVIPSVPMNSAMPWLIGATAIGGAYFALKGSK